MYPGCQCHLKYEALLPDGIWVNGPQRQWNQPLKFVFPIRGIKFRIQHLTCSPIYHRATIHHDVFLKSLPSEFLHHIFHQPLIIFFWSMTCRFRSWSRHATQPGVSEPKIISLYPVMASPSSSFVFMEFWRGIFNFFASFHSDVLFIYY